MPDQASRQNHGSAQKIDRFVLEVARVSSLDPEMIALEINRMSALGLRPARGVAVAGLLRQSQLVELVTQTKGRIRIQPNQVEPNVYRMMPKHLIEQYTAAPVEIDSPTGKVIVAYSEDRPLSKVEQNKLALSIQTDEPPLFRISSSNELTALFQYMSNIDGDLTEQQEAAQAQRLVSVHNYEILAGGDDHTSQDIRTLLTAAIAEEASDVHLNTDMLGGSEVVTAKLRIDGDMVFHQQYSYERGNQILARFRQLTIRDPNLHSASDGRYDITLPGAGGRFDMRLAFVPLREGQGQMLTIRMLPQEKRNMSQLEDVFPLQESDITRQIKKALGANSGIVLSSGPTGSGKSTTLAAALSYLVNPTQKICTVEDPVENMIEGAYQLGVTGHMTFAQGLRALLRSDPNVIMVGEIRDRETAAIAIEASQTGHMIVSTVHANRATATPARVIRLGIAHPELAEECKLIIAQRLAKRLCQECSPDGIPRGCPLCRDGFKGRVAVAETLEFTEQVKEAMYGKATPSELESTDGFSPFEAHAHNLIEKKVTTLMEIKRVLGQDVVL